MIRIAFILATLLMTTGAFAQTINVAGAWERDDEKMRTLTNTEAGNVKMNTEEGEIYIYYRISENVYQMEWTKSLYGGYYRWTMKVVGEDTIHNVYEVKGSSNTHMRIYKRLFF